MAREKVKFEKAQIMFKNFAGAPTPFDKKGGTRQFAIRIENAEDLANLQAMGFNVKFLKKRNETDPDVAYITVKVNFKFSDDGTTLLGPNIYMINGKKKTHIMPQTAVILDSADIAYCDILVNPYYYEVNGNSGVSAYLDTMYVNLNVDPFAENYAMYDDDIEAEGAIQGEEIPFE